MPDIYNPDLYIEAPPHKVFEELRQTNPVFFQEIPGEQGYYAILRHSDVVQVSREPNLFSSYEGGVVLEDMPPENLSHMRNMLLGMDPPRHTNWRRNISPNFRAQVIAQMEEQIREITRSILDKVGDGGEGEKVELVHEICAHLPSNVMGVIMDIPEEDREQIHRWAEMQAGGQDVELNPDAANEETGDYGPSANRASMDMALYAIEHAAKHRQKPESERFGLTELILSSEVDGSPMSDADFGSFFVQLVTAGNDTTRTMLTGGVLALLEHPNQLAELRADKSLIPNAVEEILRWANPLHYFRRTTTKDTKVADTKIKAGEKIAMIYTSANRDEEVFENPHDFDIHRSPNPHLSFGIGQHFCLGVYLARLEGRIFFEEFLDAFSGIELCGEPRRTRSNLNNSLKEMPVLLTR